LNRAALRRRLWRPATIVVLAPVVFATAMAASISLTTDQVGAGSAATSRCSAAGLEVIPNLAGANVASVTVKAVPAGCQGRTLSLTLNNNAGTNSSGASAVPGAGCPCNVTVTLAVATAATPNEQIDWVIT
jgi:hypothetical protein